MFRLKIMNEWIKLKDKIIDKNSIIALEYKKETGQTFAVLKVYLVSGSEITVTYEEATVIWEEFNQRIGSLKND
jgi:hypothetical protein